MRKEFKITKEDFDVLIKACQPVAAIALQCGPIVSRQEMANKAWIRLGEKMGFDGMTVQPKGSDHLCFTAEAI